MDIEALREQMPVIPELGAPVLMGAMGLVYCFLGYRLFRFVLGLTGFVLAATSAAYAMDFVTEGHVVATLIAAGIGGICGAMALYFVYRAGIFVMGLTGGVLVALHVVPGLELEKGAYVAGAYIAAAVLGGGLALSVERFAVTVATALIGAWLVTGAGAQLFFEADFAATIRDQSMASQDWLIMVGVWIGISIVGALVQLMPGGEKKKTED